MPKTEDHIAEAILDASGPLKITGGDTRACLDPLSGDTLSMTDLSGITLYDPGALTLVAKSGTPVQDIEHALHEHGQMLAFEPCDLRTVLGTSGTSTIGGVVATNASGPRRISPVGACRDSLLGVRFVDGAGRIIKNGGRVMKNVTGYDLVKLLAGSHGTLGVLTEVSLKVLPRPQSAATLTIADLNVRDAVDLMSKALGTPFEVTGAAYLNGDTFLRLEGFAESVAYRTAALQAALQCSARVTDDPGIWADLRDATALAGQTGDLWRISVAPSQAPDVVAALPDAQVQLDWGGGLIWARVPSGFDVRQTITKGHATMLSAQVLSPYPKFQPEPAPLAALSRGLRAKFDPRGILNQGLMC